MPVWSYSSALLTRRWPKNGSPIPWSRLSSRYPRGPACNSTGLANGPVGYYSSGAMRLEAGGVEIGDGGFTDWTAKLMADKKERCLISCIATERLAALATTRPDRAEAS